MKTTGMRELARAFVWIAVLFMIVFAWCLGGLLGDLVWNIQKSLGAHL